MGRYPATAAQTHEGGSEEAEEQRSASQQQIQADPFSLRITSGDGQWLNKKDVVVTLLNTPQSSRHLFYQLSKMAALYRRVLILYWAIRLHVSM